MSRAHAPGDSIGPWCLDRHVGDGAFGSTWQAHDPVGRVAALKLLRVMPGDELRVLSRLAHPAIPAVLGAAAVPVPHVAMEFAAGRPLGDLLKRGRAPESAALQVAAVLADALAEVHRAGLAHGDLKPENILVDRISDLRIWVVDFGAAADNAIGTLHYAAPERTRGEPASPESDIYSLGLVLYEMLFGILPGFDVSTSAALMQRRTERPKIPPTTPRVHALLTRMLEVDPALRPTAAEVADALEAHGLRLPQPTGAVLRKRARAVHVPPPGLEAKLERWLTDGGSLGVVGLARTGRTHALHRAETELSARGSTCIRLSSGGTPWRSVAEALRSPVLGGEPVELPSEPDERLRARMAAEALAARARDTLYVLVDNLEQAAESTRHTAEALGALDCVHVMVTSTEPIAWATESHALAPMAEDDLDALVSATLADPAPVDELVDRLTRDGPMVPGTAIEALATACDAGVLARRARRWHLDGPAFTELVDGLRSADDGELVTSGPDVTDLAALVAIFGGPVPVARLANLAPLPRQRFTAALRELADRGIVDLHGETVTIDGPRVARAAEAACSSAPELHARVLRAMSDDDLPPLQALHHLAEAGCNRLSVDRAGRALAEGTARDPEHAARLAARLWAATPLPSIGGAVLEALLAGGRTDEARDIGQALLGSARVPRDVLVAMARYTLDVADDPAATLPLLQQARGMVATERRLDLDLLEARAHCQLGQPEDAIAVAEAACAADPGATLADQEAWVGLHGTWARATHDAGDVDAAIAILEGVPADVAAGRPCHAVLRGSLGRLFWYAGRVRDAATAMAEAATHAGLPAMQRARLENNAGVAFYSSGDRTQALERWEDALGHFERLQNPLEQIRVCNNLCVGYTEAGRWERAKTAGERAFSLAGARDEHVYAAMSAGNLGDLYAAKEVLDEAVRWYRRATELANAHNVEGEKVELARRMAAVAVRRGDADAELRARQAMARAEKADDVVEATRSKLLRLVCRARSGQGTAQLEAELAACVEVFREKKLTGHIAEGRAWSAEALLEVGNTDAALKLIDLAAAHAESANHVPLQRRVATLRKQARAMTVRTPERDKFERMLELATRVAREQDPTRLLDAIAAAGLELLDAERSFVVLVEGNSRRVVRAIGLEGPLADPNARPSRTILEKGLHGHTAYTALDVSEREELSGSKSIALNALRSAMCVPMRDGDDLLGVLYVDSTRTTEEQLGEAAHLMQALASHAAVAIGHARHLAALEQRAARAAELVHDLRSPLAAAASVLEELRDDTLADGLSADLHDEALALLAKSMRLAEMVLSNREEREETVLELGHRLTELGVQLDRYAQRQGRSVFVEATGEARALCNPDHFDRVVRNLVGNALRFSPDGGTVVVALTHTAEGAQISVTDEGDGIPAELLPTLFDRGAKGKTDKSQHGLGLAIVSRLVKEMGGTVRAENSKHAGARFTVSLPLVRAVVRKAG